jgi:hypothetical protein
MAMSVLAAPTAERISWGWKADATISSLTVLILMARVSMEPLRVLLLNIIGKQADEADDDRMRRYDGVIVVRFYVLWSSVVVLDVCACLFCVFSCFASLRVFLGLPLCKRTRKFLFFEAGADAQEKNHSDSCWRKKEPFCVSSNRGQPSANHTFFD